MNSENKENLSNYQLVKRKPSVCSISLHLRKFKITVDQFFLVTPVLQWFQLNFGAGNFRGRRQGTSALRMLLRLTAVNVSSLSQGLSSNDQGRQKRETLGTRLQ